VGQKILSGKYTVGKLLLKTSGMIIIIANIILEFLELQKNFLCIFFNLSKYYKFGKILEKLVDFYPKNTVKIDELSAFLGLFFFQIWTNFIKF